MDARFGLYTYAVVGENIGKLNILGIDKKTRVFPVERNGLSVLVSKIDTGRFKNQVEKVISEMTQSQNSLGDKVENLLLSHQEVVDALAKVATIVPFKFGTILKNEMAALKMLKDYEKKFKKLLSKFTGSAEWGLKVYANNQEFKKYLVQIESPQKNLEEKREKLSAGAAYLFGRKMEEELKDDINRQLAEVANTIFKQAEKYAFEAKLNKTLPKKLTGKDKEMVLNSTYLIEKDKVGSFNKQIERLTKRYEPMGLKLEVSGPWPAYSFT